MNRYIHLLIFGLVLISCSQKKQEQSLKLWYDEPAQYFEESLVLGNGKVGASVFGGVEWDKIYLNDATLWSGEPVDPNMNPDAHEFVPKVREALANEDYKLADKLNRNIQGKFSESFAPLGTMYVKMKHGEAHKNYRRELDLDHAIAQTTYEVEGVTYTREYFVSNPDKVMVVKLSASKSKSLDFEIAFESLLKYQFDTDGKTLKVKGYAPYHAEPDYRGDMPNAVQFDENKGIKFSSYFQVAQTDGEVVISDSAIAVSGAKEAVLLVSIETSFNGFDKDPVKEGKEYEKLANAYLEGIAGKSYVELKKDHVADYQTYYNRLNLDLAADVNLDTLPTNDRLIRYANNEVDKGLEELYFQFGRYLLISSSRTSGVPVNLQGIWNPYLRPPWSSNYTMNINVEENYWLAETGNLSEMHQPFLDFIENLSETGKVTAETFYGVNKGWAACHNSDIWAMSNPVGDFGKGHPVWACWNMSGTWTVTHLWDHYLYTQDLDFLKNKAYPLMKGAAEFCLGWMTEDKDGYLITSPSTSPENLYKLPDGSYGATLYGSTSDMSMIRECFLQVIRASELLEVDKDFRNEIQSALEKLYPYQIGEKGHLQEWYHDWEDWDPKHRHQSHLFGLHPGTHINPTETPALAKACEQTLIDRGDETTGWSKGWRINLWAKLYNGEKAYKMYRELLRYVDPSGLETNYSDGGGTYPNLFDAHPPFQIDGNFGGAAAVLEMIAQSNEDEILLLPALPSVWSEGKLQGVCARNGFELDVEWSQGKLDKVTVRSKAGKPCMLVYGDKRVDLETVKGEEYRFGSDLARL